MPNSGGPRSSRRKLYAHVVNSILLYGVYIQQAESDHRRACLRVIGGRPHVAYEATYVLAGIPPLALLADERARLYGRRREDAKDEERLATLSKWQEAWDRSEKARWTHQLIPNIRVWIERRHGELNYHLTQLLTGHGFFKHHSRRYDYNQSAQCLVCPLSVENAEHYSKNSITQKNLSTRKNSSTRRKREYLKNSSTRKIKYSKNRVLDSNSRKKLELDELSFFEYSHSPTHPALSGASRAPHKACLCGVHARRSACIPKALRFTCQELSDVVVYLSVSPLYHQPDVRDQPVCPSSFWRAIPPVLPSS
ncbi:unnamed protein product [Trichogramma brassicae]|uniref:Uncharacterized protein n=1 Tax=Trichogramma brassicae TaxID=86971 RepID=A0A6H5I4D1_9HYME|nr:unnamed protein product [Trichogramma brassicae]